MKLEVNFNRKEIETSFEKVKNILLDYNNFIHIKYFNFDHKTFDKLNQELLKAISGNDIVYCIWSGESMTTLIPKYIGHTAGKTSRQRIRNHLTSKHDKTGAQLEKVKYVLSKKGYIGLSFVIVEPAYMRKSLEEWLIDNLSRQLEWNQIGRTNKKIKV